MKKFFLPYSLIILGLIIQLLFYISATHTRWFDYLFPGDPLQICSGCHGMDFYQIPNAWHAGILSGDIPKGVTPWYHDGAVNANVYHPLTAIVLGYILTQFEAHTAFYFWMLCKLVLTASMVMILYIHFRQNKHVGFALFVFLAFTTQYIDIAIGQYQFLLDMFFLLFFIEIATSDHVYFETAYYLLSLLIKPMGLLFIPALLIKGKWKVAVIGGGLFVLVTIPFLLNGTGTYYTHNIIGRVLAPWPASIQVFALRDLLQSFGVPELGISMLKYGALVFIVYVSLFQRIHIFKSFFLSIVFYLLFMDNVFEYYFASLIPIFVISILTLPEFQTRKAKICILCTCLPSIFPVLRLFNWHIVYSQYGANVDWISWRLEVLSKLIPLLALTFIVMQPDIQSIWAATKTRLYSIRRSAVMTLDQLHTK